ncbi:hypothetical protein PQG67_05295 [Corynebacterium pseudodiphtheriticum]|uniref:hypothetical protein n=1 Tax=Corynebacterium pseudodiphtheriticum TaxID=37637 RepID=UPI00234D5841|nr:hypothetical protein [Corynebacterium pseudodiphtheriticum]MDC7067853.1 hypothetical protein [Corynebacterium pseudodiphtheriticum]MDC7084079.1 hypothetical protein [Corynebacterium pseudodiphtheriticum]MDC7086370.1 hypothetical protein [Corynebacterium pseudodiphtheriticum]
MPQEQVNGEFRKEVEKMIQELNLEVEAVQLADQDDHWHFVTCGVILGSGDYRS